jgi:hypothetical protein
MANIVVTYDDMMKQCSGEEKAAPGLIACEVSGEALYILSPPIAVEPSEMPIWSIVQEWDKQ